jgi:cyclophilin family peptidyl-prolyl cis-trans isomerase
MKRLASLPFVALLLTCSTNPAPTGRPELPSPDVPDLEIRALLLLLVDQQRYEPVTVVQALSGDASLRRDLALALARIPDREGRRILEGLLLDDDPEVRRAAAFGLGELEDPAGQAALLNALANADRETAVLAVEALGKLGAPVVDVVERLLPLEDNERWARLLPGLFRFREENTVRIAERGLEQIDPALHAWAAYALAREPRPEALALLRRLLADPSPRVRAWAARAVGMVGEGVDLDALRILLEDPAVPPVLHALRAARALVTAGKAPAPEDWGPRLAELLRDGRDGVGQATLEVAGELVENGSETQVGTVLAGIADTGERWERGLALVALATARDPRALVRIESAAVAEEQAHRARAAEAAGALGLPAGAKLLERLAADPSPRVRAAAVGAWLAADPQSAEVATRALSDADVGVRATALGWLAEHPVAPLSALEPALASALASGSEEVGLAAIEALTARAKAEPLERGGIVALIERAAAAGPYVLRRAAGASLGQLERPVPTLAPVATGREIQAYREAIQRTRKPRTVTIRTARGAITVELACPEAPLTCLNFLQLAAQGYFDGLTFHRVVPDFVVQGGDPRGDGIGGPGYSIRDEINLLRYGRGMMGMALAGPDTGGSQFFFTLSPQPHLDGGYTIFGRVIEGEKVLDKIRLGDRMEKVMEVGQDGS